MICNEELERFDEKGGARHAVHHALESQVELAKARSELTEAGLGEEMTTIKVEVQPSSSSKNDIRDLMMRMRDIADHEEV
jgi:hypothetical protein